MYPSVICPQVNYITFPPQSDRVVEESAFCGMLEENVPKYFPIYELSFLIFFFIPLCVIIALYAKIGQQIRSHSLGLDGSVHGETKQSQSRKSIIRMLCEYRVMCQLEYLNYATLRKLQVSCSMGEWVGRQES